MLADHVDTDMSGMFSEQGSFKVASGTCSGGTVE